MKPMKPNLPFIRVESSGLLSDPWIFVPLLLVVADEAVQASYFRAKITKRADQARIQKIRQGMIEKTKYEICTFMPCKDKTVTCRENRWCLYFCSKQGNTHTMGVKITMKHGAGRLYIENQLRADFGYNPGSHLLALVDIFYNDETTLSSIHPQRNFARTTACSRKQPSAKISLKSWIALAVKQRSSVFCSIVLLGRKCSSKWK